MKKWLALGVLACGSSSTSVDPTALTEPVAQNIAISEIALLQVVKVPVMQNGTAADHSGIPIVALRDAILRVYVNPQSGYQSHKLTARARIVTAGPTETSAQVFSTTATVDRPSLEDDLTTTLNIPIPGVALEVGSTVTVVLNDASGDPADTTTSNAKWPQDGSQADLGVRGGGDHLKVMIVPVQYDADGSHRLPDTSDAQIEAYRVRFSQLYPTADVEITVHDPWPYSGAVNGSGSGIDALLLAATKLRSSDQPDVDVYYYAAFEATNDFGAFCGGGCITGLSGIGPPTSVGIGYTGDVSTETAVHEVGHAHGLGHAPCGGAQGITPGWPYPTASITVWGYDSIAKTMVDPSVANDLMGYCPPTWISDFHYNMLFTRVRRDNGYYYDFIANGRARTAKKFSVANVAETGVVKVSDVSFREPWVENGQPREVRWSGGTTTAYWFPYDHAPGGMLLVPDEVPASASITALRPSETTTTITR